MTKRRAVRYGRLIAACIAGVVATLVAYVAFTYAFGYMRDRTLEPEGSLWVAFFIVLPAAILIGGLATGLLLRSVRPSLSVLSLIALTPGAYLAFLAGVALLCSICFEPTDDGVPYSDPLFFVLLGVIAGIAALSFLGVMLGCRLFKRADTGAQQAADPPTIPS